MDILLWIISIFIIILHSNHCDSQHWATIPVTDAWGNEIPIWNRPESPNSPDNRIPIRPRTPCQTNPCQNSGTCLETSKDTFTCTCRPLYLGERCEVVVKPPDKLKPKNIGLDFIQVVWRPPNGTKTIYGYVVQQNEFGDRLINLSRVLPPETLQHTIKGLKEDTRYIVCINIIFDNEAIPVAAVLRDQCIEVKTEGVDRMPSEELILIAVICSVVFMTLLLLCILILCCRLQANKGEEATGTFPSVSWRRTRDNSSYQDRSYLTNGEEARYTNEELFHQNKTNNASSRSSYNDDVFMKRLSGQKPQYVNNHPVAARSVSVTDHHSAINPLKQEARSQSSSSAMLAQKQANRLSSALNASYRELPPSISSHMMRSPTSRDKDATDEFDIGGSYYALS